MKTVGIFNDTSTSGHFGCTAVMNTLVSELERRQIKPSYLWPVGLDWQPYKAKLEQAEPDMIIVNGEGTIHHSTERKRTRDLLAVAPYAKSQGKPAHLVNASITALDASAIEALRAFDTIHVRESESRQYLAEHKIEAQIVPDLSLGISAPKPAETRDGIIVTDSVYRDTAQGLKNFSDLANAGFVKMKKRLPFQARLISKIQRNIQGSPASTKWRPRSDVEAFVRDLAGKELLVTGRFHSVLLSILTDTPFIALPSNTRKIEAVLHDALMSGSRLISPNDLLSQKFLAETKRGIPFTSDELEALASYRTHAKNSRSAMFDLIADSVLQ